MRVDKQQINQQKYKLKTLKYIEIVSGGYGNNVTVRMPGAVQNLLIEIQKFG